MVYSLTAIYFSLLKISSMSEVRSEHKACFGASLRHTKGFKQQKNHLRSVTSDRRYTALNALYYSFLHISLLYCTSVHCIDAIHCYLQYSTKLQHCSWLHSS